MSLQGAGVGDSFGGMTAAHLHPVSLTVILALTYAGLALGRVPGLRLNRSGIALLGAIAAMIFGGVSTAEVVSFINWPTIFLLFGFFVISAQLRLSGAYDLVAKGISARLGHPARFLFILMLVTAGLSAILNHDIVCFVFTPIVGGRALLRGGLNPVPFLVGLALASNVGSAATLIGNPQDMLLGQVAHLSFGRYILWSILPVELRARRLVRDRLAAVAEKHPRRRAGRHATRGEIPAGEPLSPDQGAGDPRGGHRPVLLAAAEGDHRAGRGRPSSREQKISHR